MTKEPIAYLSINQSIYPSIIYLYHLTSIGSTSLENRNTYLICTEKENQISYEYIPTTQTKLLISYAYYIYKIVSCKKHHYIMYLQEKLAATMFFYWIWKKYI